MVLIDQISYCRFSEIVNAPLSLLHGPHLAWGLKRMARVSNFFYAGDHTDTKTYGI